MQVTAETLKKLVILPKGYPSQRRSLKCQTLFTASTAGFPYNCYITFA